MNKLIVATIAAVSAGICVADVTSANVVGYQQTDLGAAGSKSMLTPTFVNMTDKDYPIDNFAIIGATKDKQADIQVMDAEGKWIGHYYWFLEYVDKKGNVTPAGWFNLKGTQSAGISLKPGEGVYLNVSANNLKIQSAGQVADKQTINLAVGKSLLGNASPVEIAVDKFAIVGATKDKQVDIQTMDATGKWTGHYYWFLEYVDKKGNVTPAGWFNLKGTVPAGITLKPGETIYLNTSTANLKLEIPAAL